MKKIIAFAGLKNSGKDTASKMMRYCLSVPRFLRTYTLYKILDPFIISKWTTTSFARHMKEMLAILINEPVKKFDDRDFKENYYVNLNTIHVTTTPPRTKIMTDKRLSRWIKSKRLTEVASYYITIRQLLQIFGTEIIRNYFGDNFWVNRTLLEDKKIIISDLRFTNEYERIKKLDGITIYIDRRQNPGLHRSENEVVNLFRDNKFDYIIDNRSDLKNLFNDVAYLASQIQNK